MPQHNETKGRHAATADSLSVAVGLVPHLHDLHHVQVNGLIGNSDGKHSIDNSLQTRQEVAARLAESKGLPLHFCKLPCYDFYLDNLNQRRKKNLETNLENVY